MIKPLVFMNAKVEPGTKRFTYLEFVRSAVNPIRIPLMLVNGSKKGPTLCLIAGVHGMEYCGTEAVIRTFNQIRPEELVGSIVAIPMVNVLSFEKSIPTFCPIDNVNMASIWPGKPDGSISYRITSTIFEEIIVKSNYLVDFHGGDQFEDLTPFTVFVRIGDDAIDSRSENMARAFGTRYVFEATTRFHMVLMHEAPKRGIPTILAEAGGEAKLEEKWVNVHFNGIRNIMKSLEMLDGTTTIPIKQEKTRPYIAVPVSVTCGGIFYPEVKAGDIVSKGQLLAKIKDVQGKTIEEILSPENGLVQYVNLNPAKNSGDTFTKILKLGE